MTTKKELMEIVAKYFEEEIKDHDFETFEDMKRSFDWDSKDIRTEVEWTIYYAECGWMMMDDSDIYHFEANGGSDDLITYRQFINGVYKILKEKNIYA